MNLCTYQRGGGGPWGLDQQKITSPRTLTEHFDTATGPQIEILEEIMCTFYDTHRGFLTHICDSWVGN